jgi:hypothetical protein
MILVLETRPKQYECAAAGDALRDLFDCFICHYSTFGKRPKLWDEFDFVKATLT